MADERHDLFEVAVDHVAARLVVRLHHERLDHEGHAEAVALRLERADPLDALAVQVRLVGKKEQVDDDGFD